MSGIGYLDIMIAWKQEPSDGLTVCSKCGDIIPAGAVVHTRTGYAEDPTRFCEPCVTPKN
jgi:hypothetical protein